MRRLDEDGPPWSMAKSQDVLHRLASRRIQPLRALRTE